MSVRRVGRLLVLPMVVAGVARAAMRRRGQRADAALWAAATDAAADLGSRARTPGAGGDSPAAGTATGTATGT
jgi:hypothetical protein